ncbi:MULTISPECIES: hypothetical protein [unclassified Bradyrhizobium]|uniref:hypothetical protein n=1 Tax=unclassified Bradyrhizobium TaxID=2631580 RepID=UPI0028EFE953|nr:MULTISPECIES: hypothetical protein [unclassified Bradyrhizobium]
MPLTCKQKALIALRIVIARFLDDYAAPSGVSGQSIALDAACSRLSEWVARTDGEVDSHEGLQKHLSRAAAALESLIDEDARFPRDRIEAAIAAIRICVAGAQPNNGDGYARPTEGASGPCLCGFLDLARRIEEYALASYSSAEDSFNPWPQITYTTVLTPDTMKKLQPFNVGGDAEIGTVRRVILTVKDDKLSAIDLCQIAYVLFHEIVCHGFQGVVQAETVNAKPQCHWTEGWMDAVAYRMAVAAALQKGGVLEWLPLVGPDAEAAMAAVHNARYLNPTGLKPEDAKVRRAARVALSDLQSVFRDAGMARAHDDSEALARKFSLLANANADSKKLLRLSTMLQNVLLSKVRNDDKVYASNACLEFLQHRDIDRLLLELQTLPRSSTQMRVGASITRTPA